MNLMEFMGRGCVIYNLSMEEGYSVHLPCGNICKAVIHIHGTGARKGMLIFTNADDIWPFRESVTAMGYGFSVLGDGPYSEPFDAKSFFDMINDWGIAP